MTAAGVSRSSRRFTALGLSALVGWQVAAAAGVGRRFVFPLGVVGFVCSVAFGKAYALVPTYFGRELAFAGAPRIHAGLAAVGVGALVAGTAASIPALAAGGAAVWTGGVLVFLATLGWTVRGNLSGRETATGEANAHRERVDRLGNAFVPVAGLYLALGSYELLALRGPVPSLVGQGRVGVAHLLAAGFAVLLLLSVGARLLPRFAVATPPRPLVATALAAGALGPALIVAGYPTGPLFVAGAVLEAAAVVGFAAAVGRLLVASDRDRVGFVGVGAGVASGVAGVLVGLGFATGILTPAGAPVLAHLRLNVLGLLGLSIVGFLLQFYPPTVGGFAWNDDRVALAAQVALAVGLWVEAGGLLAAVDLAVAAGRFLGLAGAIGVAAVVAGVFRFQAQRRRDRG